MKARGAAAQGGFTLLEILVAIALMALLLGSLLPVFQRGLNVLDVGNPRSRALLVANGKLAEVLHTEELTPQGGELSASGEVNEYNWQVLLTPYQEDDLGPVENDWTSAYQVRVEVSWEDAGRRRSVLLESLKVGAANLKDQP